MGAYINRKQVNGVAVGAQPAIPLNRWGNNDYTVKVSGTGTSAYTLQATIDQINRDGVTPSWFTINDEAGSPISGATTETTYVISNTPLEAIRISHDVSTASTFHVMQSGDC